MQCVQLKAEPLMLLCRIMANDSTHYAVKTCVNADLRNREQA
jgi:hypothetical protein